MNNKTVFGIMCILFNYCGIPSLMQGHIQIALTRIALISFIPLTIVNFVFGIITGIKVLQMSDEEYASKKGTFKDLTVTYKGVTFGI